MRQRLFVTALSAALSIAGLAGCGTASGLGHGRLTSPGKPGDDGPVVFRWRAERGGTAGAMWAVLPDGRRYEGRFMHVTSATGATEIDPFVTAWGAAWPAGSLPPYARGPYSSTTFVVQYSGLVIATLRGPSGEAMRCRFQLERPEEGLGSGGAGDCELSTGETVRFGVLERE